MAQATDLIYTQDHDGSWVCSAELDALVEYEAGYGSTPQEARSVFITINSLDWTDFAKRDVDDMDEVMNHAIYKFDALPTLTPEARNTAFLMWFEATFCK